MSVAAAPEARETLPLSPTPRTTLNRRRDRASTDRTDLYALLDEALICHGPDKGARSICTARWPRSAFGRHPGRALASRQVVDGLVLARSAFHHSMNYRCAVVTGTARSVTGPDEKVHALNLVVDHAVPGRTQTLRPHTRGAVSRAVPRNRSNSQSTHATGLGIWPSPSIAARGASAS